MRVAGIDCGTNSIRLLIADVPGANGAALDDIVRRMEIVRLGEGVDRTGRFDPDALQRTLDVVSDYAAQCDRYGVEAIRFVATSASRDASNRDVFIAGVRERLGVDPRVISGNDEARFSFRGAISALGSELLGSTAGAGSGGDAVPVGDERLILTVDLGGGSTELALGRPDGQVVASYSMDVGSVRMRERHLHSDPVTDAEIIAARADVNALLDAAEQQIDLSSPHVLVGLAGTVTTVTAQALGLESYVPERIHGTRLTWPQIDEVCEWFLRASLGGRRALGFMHPGRADVIHAGALVWQQVVRRVVERTAHTQHPIMEAVTSEHDILDGVTLWAAEAGD
ncbi:MAG: Ppx/GppA phosphatase family protein [Arcanobacterium sp.]|nr:Ppx/GppA phosphatase family protein [Arcanobacterium sp.]